MNVLGLSISWVSSRSEWRGRSIYPQTALFGFVDDCPTISSALLIHEPRLCKEQKHPLIFETHKMRKGGGEEIDLRRIREGESWWSICLEKWRRRA